MTDTAPRIYVACLASYNNGKLYGRWIDATTDVDAMSAEINDLLRGSPEPNVMRAEYENETGERHISSGSNGEFKPVYESASGDTWRMIGKPFPSAEEWAIHDHEGLGDDLGEYAGLAEVARRVAIIDLADERDIPAAVLMAFAHDYMSGEWDADDLGDKLDDAYDGTAESWKAFAETTIEETDSEMLDKLPGWLQANIDWQGIGHDWELSGDWSAYRDGDGDGGDLYFFRTC